MPYEDTKASGNELNGTSGGVWDLLRYRPTYDDDDNDGDDDGDDQKTL